MNYRKTFSFSIFNCTPGCSQQNFPNNTTESGLSEVVYLMLIGPCIIVIVEE